jgi:hypothetical protein
VYFDEDILTAGMLSAQKVSKSLESNVTRVYAGLARRNEDVANASEKMNSSVRKVGSSFLWVGLGSMFLTMNIRQLVMEMNNIHKQALSLLRSFASFDDTLESVRDTLVEYGAGSVESRKALRDLGLTQLELKYNVQSLADAYKNQMLTAFMLTFSMMGQSLGTMSMLGSSFDRLHLSTYEYARAVNNLNIYELQNAAILEYINSVMGLDTNSKAANTLATKLNAISAKQAEQANLGLAGSQQLSFMATLKQRIGLMIGVGANQAFTVSTLMSKLAVDMLIGSLTFGITILASFAMSEMLASRQMDRMNDELKRMGGELGINTDVDSLSDSFYGLSDSISSSATSLTQFKSNLLETSKIDTSTMLIHKNGLSEGASSLGNINEQLYQMNNQLGIDLNSEQQFLYIVRFCGISSRES